MRNLALLAVAVVAALAGCSDGDPPAGGERAACRADGTCDVGLECWSEVCVRPPSADCGAVAARLAPIRLGNYATDLERGPVLAELRAQCQREQLTAREGRCLVSAADDDALADCPRALLPELDGVRRRCLPLGPIALAFEGGQVSAAAAHAISETLVEQCIAERYAKPITTCMAGAGTVDAVRACAAELPGAARRTLDRKLDRAIARGGRPRRAPPDPWAAAGTGQLPPQCARYLQLLDAYATCSQVPQPVRDSLRQAVDQMKQSWANLPPDAFPTADSACATGVDAMAQSMSAFGCTAPPPP